MLVNNDADKSPTFNGKPVQIVVPIPFSEEGRRMIEKKVAEKEFPNCSAVGNFVIFKDEQPAEKIEEVTKFLSSKQFSKKGYVSTEKEKKIKSPRKRIDLNGIDWTGLNLRSISLEGQIRVPPRSYRLHQWSDEVALKKRLGRWEVVLRKERERLAIIEAEIEKLEKRLKELEELKGNSEFSQDKQRKQE